ncbi:TPA: class II fructose-bisphosphatase [Escherichia coli]|nr:class II fructose-bisphosphatase [Escherichia coli]
MENKSARAKVQAFGGFLTAMVIPNIGAFIAWGFITALFIPTGWLPNEHFAKIVGPMITYLLPVMIGSTGGHLVGGKRGAVMGGIGTIGVIVGAEIPMFLGSMIMGPLGGLVIKYVDKALEKRIPAGFEMVINNFSLGIAGMLLCLLGFEVIGPAVLIANTFVKECIEALVHAGYLPLLSVINEPAKVLFLNNAIDQGVYYPLGMQQASVNGKSIFFMVASNPGPGLGLLLAFTLFGKGMSKRSAPGAMIIHFLGGIHELYFPYVLMKPLTIIAMIAGGMSGTWMFNLLDGGLVAGPSPGSIFAYLALTPKGSFLATIAGVTVGTLDKPRLSAAIEEATQLGVKVFALPDGDVAASVLTCWQDNPYDVMYTIGGAPEGVISACAVKALGGDMQAELIDFCQAKGDYTENRQIAEQERKRCKAMGVDVNRVYSLDELVRGNDILFSATGVTGGELVNGIQQTANGVRTQTLLIGGADQTCNIIDSLH